MTDHAPPERLTSLDGVLYDWSTETGHTVSDLASLRTRLLARENVIADHLRVMGASLGAMPEFVAEALCQTGLGDIPSESERLYIHQQFHDRMEQLRREFPQMFGNDPDN